MRKRRRVTPVGSGRAGAAGAALVLGSAGILLGLAAGPAQAAEVSFATHCVPPAGITPVDGTTKVEITAPATAKVGDTVDVVWKFVQAASKNPDIIDLPANSVQPSGVLKAAGAQAADIAMQGTRTNPAIPKGAPMVLSDMKGTLKLTAPGEVTLTPDAYTVNAMSTDTKCTPKETVQKAATIAVTPGDGSTSSTTPDPTDSASQPPSSSPSDTASASASASASDGTGGDQTDFTGKEVEIPYTCQSPIGEKKATSPIQIDARKNGGGFDLTVQFKKSVMNSPADIPKGSVKPSMEVVLGGADKGTVHVEGPTNSKDIKSGDPIDIPDLTGTYKPGADGRSTLSPGVLTINALGTTTTCKPDRTEASLTLDTTQQASGASGGSSSSSGGTSSSSSGGGLAETGSSDHGALKALGLVAGTAVLSGAAVFTFMPGRRGR
ncbi:hypothetical protein [Streptomyces guryensis]|uniref:Gram-positive cocci surface proteins LPxTG domain-containing protein n=1 Tax=Streptomyces guryensis TaxID=2886947 RepID=A0A9Q3VQC1_9ACTN|nr:hypothetical protein [Streptomyces guryensis]MCD9875483.1 hypothetical protein [Streptomyces guryensis]